MDEETTYVWKAYEVRSGELVVCEAGNPDAWLRSDTVVPLVDSEARPHRRQARE